MRFKEYYTKEEFSRACIEELRKLADALEKGVEIDHRQYDKWAESLNFKALVKIVANQNGEGKKDKKKKEDGKKEKNKKKSKAGKGK